MQTFDELLNTLEMVKQIDAQSLTGDGVLKLMKLTWQACESSMRERVVEAQAEMREKCIKAECFLCAANAYVYFQDIHWKHIDGSICQADGIRALPLDGLKEG